MRSEPVCAAILGFALLAGCKPEPHRPDAGPPRYLDWDIQLAAPFDISAPRAMYTLNLWDVVPAATMLDYGDNDPVAVPAGALAGALADLHARTPRTKVVCHTGGGTIRLDDPDARKFPGYGASPPNRPTPPAADSVIGWSTSLNDANERFIDIHSTKQDIVAPLIGKRIELAQQIGCDEIVVKDTDVPAYQDEGDIVHGFSTISFEEYVSWSNKLSDRAHALQVSIGIRNKSSLGADDFSMTYDWTMVERCAEFKQECVGARPFLNRAKEAFAIEYDLNADDGKPNDLTTLCNELKLRRIDDGIIKSAALSSAYYMRCP